MAIDEAAEKRCLLANTSKRQFIDTDKLTPYLNSEGGYTKILHACGGELSGMFPFLIANRPPRYPTMGAWQGDCIEVVYSDSGRFVEIHEGIAQGWQDISKEVDREYGDFMNEPACDFSA